MSAERLAIAQVCPFPWEFPSSLREHIRNLSGELIARGHQVVVIAPSTSPEVVRASRETLREDPQSLLTAVAGEPRLLAVGEVLSFGNWSRRAPSLPVDVARTIDEAMELLKLDVVHVHDPYAPSASSAALRTSRALNVASFHDPTERTLSTQLGRPLAQRLYNRVDARITSYEATRTVLERYFPGEYRVITPAAAPIAPGSAGALVSGGRASGRAQSQPGGRTGLRIAFVADEERQALRVLLRALRTLPAAGDWHVTVCSGRPLSTPATLSHRLREHVSFVEDEAADIGALIAASDVVVLGSLGTRPTPSVIVRALAAGAVPVVTGLPVYEELTDQGDAGLLYTAGDFETLGAHLGRLLDEPELLESLLKRGAKRGATLNYKRLGDEIEAVYTGLAARRHDRRARNEAARAAVGARKLIDVDLHMHTDHSYDCATPVEVLLATARARGLGAIAVTEHNEISGALAAAELAPEYGVKVIVGEEVKTAHQGEIIGLFLQEKIPGGLTLVETIADIKRQGGVVYVPHPFDRMHSVLDYENLRDVLDDVNVLEIFNPRIAIAEYNAEAVRFAARYRMTAAAGSDAHVPQGLGSVRIRMHDFDGPAEFLESLRDADITRDPASLLLVQGLKFIQNKAMPAGAREASRRRRLRRVAH